jgi:hypothetical protein
LKGIAVRGHLAEVPACAERRVARTFEDEYARRVVASHGRHALAQPGEDRRAQRVALRGAIDAEASDPASDVEQDVVSGSSHVSCPSPGRSSMAPQLMLSSYQRPR